VALKLVPPPLALRLHPSLAPTATPTANPLLAFRRELPAMAALAQLLLLLHKRARFVRPQSAAAPLNAAP